MDWEFSSIHAYWLERQTRIAKGEGMELFGGENEFKIKHQAWMNLNDAFEF